jgi:hypothetical protein
MRTAIFVYEPTTVTITATENLQLASFDGAPARAVTASALAVGPGIYKIVSASPVSVVSASSRTQVLSTTSDKDKWPDPPPATLPGTLAGTAPPAIWDFFVVPGAKRFDLV